MAAPRKNSNPSPSAAEPAAPGAEAILPGGKLDPEAVRRLAAESIDSPESDETEAEEGLCHVRFTLTRDLDKRLDKYLTDRITFLSRNQLQKLIELGAVTVNGRAAKASVKLHTGDTIDVAVPPPPPTEIQPEDIPLDVLYEDPWFIVLNKSADLIVHPARSHNTGTLLNALTHHFRTAPGAAAPGSLSSVGREFARPGVVHRLDRKTSGVIVVAKEDEAHWKLGRQFEQRQVDKRYLALVHGLIETDADVIDVPLGPSHSRVKGQREKQAVRHDELGKPAVTIYRVRQRFESPRVPGGPVLGGRPAAYTLVELELKTGRTHQIRVHMAHLGYPLVGDDMYGGRHLPLASLAPGAPPDAVFDRQALHAAVLGFRHPVSGEPLQFTAPVPEDLATLIWLLRSHWRASPIQTPPGATIDLARALPEP